MNNGTTVVLLWQHQHMGIFDSIARGLGSLRSLSEAELADEREALRQRYVSSGGDLNEAARLDAELRRYDVEMTRRANAAFARENPKPPERRHREHGWYLPNDD
ncbi:hypothetical protein [Kitasatospora cineracea]|uniref:hypothetical protein n=1 Tax=Kitasatospora cineracea TaxID=88074 RepID=UPI001FC9B14A|nr:hypothetical protein [Kitasatospora cineracea]